MGNSLSANKRVSPHVFRINPNVSVSVLNLWNKKKCKCGTRLNSRNKTGFCLKCRAKLLRSNGGARFKPLAECLNTKKLLLQNLDQELSYPIYRQLTLVNLRPLQEEVREKLGRSKP